MQSPRKNSTSVSRGLGGLARRIGLGRIAYQLYFRPRGFVERCWRSGAVNLWRSYRGRCRMERAARHLPPIEAVPTADSPAVHFLTGKRFWYQTCFCAWSLLRHAREPLRLVVYDDGSLDADSRSALVRVFPSIQVIGLDEIEQRLNRHLPADRFPSLRQRRLVYPHLRKLTDVHAGSTGWKLVLDSDMLFLRKPAFLLSWLRAPDRPCYMLDYASAYGYTLALMQELVRASIPEKLNVGICGLRSEEVDWDQVEAWCRTLLAREGSSYFQEQALTAMLLAGRSCAVAPGEEYIIRPSEAEVIGWHGVMHHYVAESKAWYFRRAWPNVLRGEATFPGAEE